MSQIVTPVRTRVQGEIDWSKKEMSPELTPKEIAQIKALYAALVGYTLAERGLTTLVAETMGVTYFQVYNVLKNRSTRHGRLYHGTKELPTVTPQELDLLLKLALKRRAQIANTRALKSRRY